MLYVIDCWRKLLWISVTGCGYAARIGIRNSVTVKKDRHRITIDETSRATEKRLTMYTPWMDRLAAGLTNT
jgi:hypothetical protein